MLNFILSADKRAELINDMKEWWESHRVYTKDGEIEDHVAEIDDDPNSPFDLYLWETDGYGEEFYVRILPAEVYEGYGKAYDEAWEEECKLIMNASYDDNIIPVHALWREVDGEIWWAYRRKDSHGWGRLIDPYGLKKSWGIGLDKEKFYDVYCFK